MDRIKKNKIKRLKARQIDRHVDGKDTGRQVARQKERDRERLGERDRNKRYVGNRQQEGQREKKKEN